MIIDRRKPLMLEVTDLFLPSISLPVKRLLKD